MFLHQDSKDSDQTGRMPKLICLRWAHRSFCCFCHEVAEIILKGRKTHLKRIEYIMKWLKVALKSL